MLASVLSASLHGIEGRVIRVEVDVAPGLPGFTIVGLPDASLQEARERVRGGIRNSGWKLVFNDASSQMWRDREARKRLIDVTYSLGVRLKENGEIEDVKIDSPAFRAGVNPATKLIGVNGRKFTAQWLHDAIHGSKTSAEPIVLLVEDGEFYKTYRVDYHDGERYPHLVRDESQPDLLSAIIAPHAK